MLFKLALFLIPFENFFFAPSSGWAAIAPIGFLVYFCSKLKLLPKLLKEEKRIIIFLLFMLVWGFFMCIFQGNFNFFNIKRTFYTLGLGIIFYFSFIIRYIIEKNSIKKDIQVLFVAYLISIFIGLLQYISYKYNIYSIIEIMKILSKRLYIKKVQFTLTEPSFLGQHLYVVVLYFYYFFKREKIEITTIQKVVTFIFPMVAIIIGRSTKFILDTGVVLFIVTCYKLYYLKTNKNLKILMVLTLLLFSLNIFAFQKEIINIIGKKDPRIEKIYEKGLYIDGSLASRYFRINASIKGYQKELYRTITGYGIGNISIPFQKGYGEARAEYSNEWLYEVDYLYDFKGHNLFCMYIKIISEYGVVFLIIILLIFFSKRLIVEYLILAYMLIQNDSYAYYGIWLYLFLKKNLKKGRNHEESTNSSCYS